VISRIRVQNFRSLVDVDVELEPLTVLIGRSGTGKSNFVNAIRRLRDTVNQPQSARERKPDQAPIGFPNAHLSFDVSLRLNGARLEYQYSFAQGDPAQRAKPTQQGMRERLSCSGRVVFEQVNNTWATPPNLTPQPTPGSLALGTLTGVREATVVQNLLGRSLGCYDFPSDVLQPRSPQNSTLGYRDDGQNHVQCAGAILQDLSRLTDWTSLTSTMNSLNSAVESIDLVLPERDKLRVGYRVGEKIHSIDVKEESEGFRRYLATLLALYQTPAKQTVIIEHPENGIHPGALETLSNEFKRHVDQGRGQVILTTHSPQLLDHFEPEQIRVVDIENGQTRIGPLAPEQIEAIKERLLKPGELLTLDPARLAGQLAEVPA
jgi:predicted ATPase